jgi:lauroyl/myristoyl acyltransferase
MTSRYVRRIEAMEAEVLRNPELRYEDAIQEIVLANFYHLCPELPWSAVLAAARALYRNQRRATIDLQHLAELMPQVDVRDRSGLSIGREPAIFCASHYAGYRLIGPLLMSLKVPVTIVIDRHVARAQGDSFSDALYRYARRMRLPKDCFVFRDTSEPSLLLGLARDVRAGRSLLFYLDGNSGSDASTARNDHTIAVDFLGNRLTSRAGIPSLSAMTGAPVVPIRMSRSAGVTENLAEFLPAMRLGNDDCSTFVRNVLQMLWSLIGEQVEVDPTQWESMRYVNKFVRFGADRRDPADRLPTGTIVFDRDRFSVRPDLKEKIIFDRRTLQLHTIGDPLATLLEQLLAMEPGADLTDSGLPPDVLGWLVQKQFAVSGRLGAIETGSGLRSMA